LGSGYVRLSFFRHGIDWLLLNVEQLQHKALLSVTSISWLHLYVTLMRNCCRMLSFPPGILTDCIWILSSC
jgi:hypothetical protein